MVSHACQVQKVQERSRFLCWTEFGKLAENIGHSALVSGSNNKGKLTQYQTQWLVRLH